MAPKTQRTTAYVTPQGLYVPNPKTIIAKRAPASRDVGYEFGTIWVDKIAGASYQMVMVSAGAAIWITLGGGSGAVATLTGNTGGGISPVGGNINIVGSGAISVAGAGSTLTISITPGTTFISTLTGNSGGALSPTAGNFNILGNNALGVNITGAGSTLTVTGIQGSTTQVGVWEGATAVETQTGTDATRTVTPASLLPSLMTPFVVGPGGAYTTIQSALTAANAAGGGMVYVKPGTYTENLTFTGNITLIGSSEQDVFIVGTHTPPTTGFLNLFRCTFQGAAAIFSSAAAGTAAIIMEDCSVNVTNGWAFDLLNWASPGSVAVDDIGPFGTTDGFFRNTGGAGFFAFSAGIGNGTTNALTVSGLTVIFGADITCPLTLQTGAILAFDNGFCAGAITFSNNSTGAINNCRLTGGASAAVTMSSSASVSILNSVISSSNNPAIAGAGAGTLTLGGNTYPLNALHAGTLTVAYASNEGVLATKNTPGASPQIIDARTGQVAFTDVIANGAYGTLTMTNSTITATSVIVASVSCTTVNSACQIVETTPGAGSVAFRIFNAGAASTAADIHVNFWVIN